MKNTFDTDTYLFGILKGSTAITSAISGSIYAGQRPLNSTLEDVTINTIVLTQEYEPQLGTSNINIHVSDHSVTLGGVQQKVANRARLKAISEVVLTAIRASTIVGVSFTIENQTVIQEAEISQHYVNVRINWFIH
jgi:hypothetical protein